MEFFGGDVPRMAPLGLMLEGFLLPVPGLDAKMKSCRENLIRVL